VKAIPDAVDECGKMGPLAGECVGEDAGNRKA